MTSVDDFSRQPDEALLVAYRNAAASHGRCSADGDHTEANAQAEVVAGAYRELRRRGADSQQQLLEFLDDDDDSVRSWVGAHALEFAPKRGESVLAALAEGKSMPAFSARMTLREWRAGRLSFP